VLANSQSGKRDHQMRVLYGGRLGVGTPAEVCGLSPSPGRIPRSRSQGPRKLPHPRAPPSSSHFYKDGHE